MSPAARTSRLTQAALAWLKLEERRVTVGYAAVGNTWIFETGTADAKRSESNKSL
ncbi:hypothetical protein GJ744_011302 [Endocarpon pusillum]|uniref:Uncharacterized protein n=1 Tax=Endocarpon pusillum TaxID=364733 RepID=A0A8H7AU33_9EURO|nr:hypothetical protein GJ744_011302 [Endocarpon pusillum]